MKDNVISITTRRGFSADLTPEAAAAASENLESQYNEISTHKAQPAEPREVSLAAYAARLAYENELQQPTPNAEGVRVGDLFYRSWGWEQTNVDFYQIIALKGKHTAIIRRICAEYVGGYGLQGDCFPCRGEWYDDDTYTVRTKIGYKDAVVIADPRDKGHTMSRTGDDTPHAYSSYA